MTKILVAAALTFVPVQSDHEALTAPVGAVAQYYVALGATCSIPSYYGPIPTCRLVTPSPLGADCFCFGDPRIGFVTR